MGWPNVPNATLPRAEVLRFSVYYMAVQSHDTQSTGTLAVQYPLFVFVSVAVYSIAFGVRRIVEKRLGVGARQ